MGAQRVQNRPYRLRVPKLCCSRKDQKPAHSYERPTQNHRLTASPSGGEE